MRLITFSVRGTDSPRIGARVSRHVLDLHRGFSVFSLWTAALFSFLLVYMVMVAHKDIKKY